MWGVERSIRQFTVAQDHTHANLRRMSGGWNYFARRPPHLTASLNKILSPVAAGTEDRYRLRAAARYTRSTPVY